MSGATTPINLLLHVLTALAIAGIVTRTLLTGQAAIGLERRSAAGLLPPRHSG
jgi:hypothetical protein